MNDEVGGELGIAGVSGMVELARNAAAIVYRGIGDGGRPVIVKVLRREATPEVRARFDYDQARLTELAEHPDVVLTVAHGYTTDGHPYLVTEQLTGGSMADRVGSGMDGPGVLSVGIKLAGALESAHRRNLVHGDLRPEDVLVTDDGEPHLADLGVALVTGLGPDRAAQPQRIAHAAPEQLETHLPTPATDVYALGSVLYALLAGRAAFVQPGDTSPMAVALRIANEPLPDLRPTGVPRPVVDVIERAMAKDPAARWPSAEAMGHALQQAEVSLGLPITPMTVVGVDRTPPRPVVEEEPAPDPAAGAAAPSAKRPKRRLLLLLLVFVLAAAGGAAFLLLGGDDDDDEGADGFERREAPDVELVEVTDDDGVITVGALERWDDVDGRNLEVADDVGTPDLVAAEDADSFLGAGGFAISGIEVTLLRAEALDAAGLEVDARAILEARVADRDLADECTTDLAPDDAEVAGFSGLLQRFEGCDGSSLAVFAGVDGDEALVFEAHLVDDEDEAAFDAVVESIGIS